MNWRDEPITPAQWRRLVQLGYSREDVNLLTKGEASDAMDTLRVNDWKSCPLPGPGKVLMYPRNSKKRPNRKTNSK